MKNIVFKTAFLFVFLISSYISNAQDSTETSVEDIDILDPHDDDGNKWFETKEDRIDFFNTIITFAKNENTEEPLSLRNDALLLSVRTDADREYDNKSYDNLICFKSNTEKEVLTDIETSYEDKHVYTLKFYVGQNITHAEFLLTKESPTGFWGEELAYREIGDVLTSTENNASRNIWLYDVEVYFLSILNSVKLIGY